MKLDIYEWQNGLKNKKDIDKDISNRLNNLYKLIYKLGVIKK